MSVNRILTCILSDNLQATKDFYVGLLDFEIGFESDWFIQLTSKSDNALEIAIFSKTSEYIPKQFQSLPAGVCITFVVDDVDRTFATAQKMGLRIVQKPKNETYGQRRFLTVDPNNCLIDISTPVSQG